MFEREKELFRARHIDVEEVGDFPYAYMDNYLISCNQLDGPAEIADHMKKLKAKVDPETYGTVMMYGTIINLSHRQTYNFIVAMMDDSFREYVQGVTKDFESHQQEVESITEYRFH